MGSMASFALNPGRHSLQPQQVEPNRTSLPSGETKAKHAVGPESQLFQYVVGQQLLNAIGAGMGAMGEHN